VTTVDALRKHGVRQFVECGPGMVLAGLVKRIDRTGEIACYALEDQASIESARTTLQGGEASAGGER